MMRQIPAPEILCRLLSYDESTGKLFWLTRGDDIIKNSRIRNSWNSRYSGKEAFTACSYGYKCGSIFGVRLMAHRVIWALKTKSILEMEIDHIDGQRGNNKWNNLRCATRKQNASNRSGNSIATSAYTGVSFHLCRGKWRATINNAGRHRHLGYFVDEIEAAKSYDTAATKTYGVFARRNFSEGSNT